jgi:class 3 adenylate cyclase
MAQLPTSSLIVLLDIERYGERPDGVAPDLRESMYRIADEALTEAGVVREHRHVEDRGDGLLILLPQAGPVEVLGAFVRELESLVRHRAASRTPAYRMRLRVAIANGFVRHDGKGWIGSAINKAARLVDSAPVRAALTDNASAHVAVIITEDLYQDVVAQNHPAIDAGRYREAPVQVKELDGRAWVCVPNSGAEPAPGAGAPDAPPPPGGSYIGNQVNHGDQHIHGDFTGMTVQLPGTWS